MEYQAFIVLVTGISLLLLGNSVYHEKKGCKYHLLYSRVFYLAGFNELCLFLFSALPNEKTAIFFLRLLTISHFIVPLILHIVLLWYENKRTNKMNKWIYIFIYFIPFVFAVFYYFRPELLYSISYSSKWCRSYGYHISQYHLFVYSASYFLFFLIPLALLVIIVKHPNDEIKKEYMLFKKYSFVMVVFLFCTIKFILPHYVADVFWCEVIGGICLGALPIYAKKKYNCFIWAYDPSPVIAQAPPLLNYPSVLPQSQAKTVPPQKISVPTKNGYMFIEVKCIIYVEADGNYSRLYLINQPSILVCRSLIEFDKLLTNSGFVRVHRGHLVNVHHIVFYSLKEQYVQMSNGTNVSISVRKRNFFKDYVMEMEQS